jgi:serine/threonine protein kinase
MTAVLAQSCADCGHPLTADVCSGLCPVCVAVTLLDSFETDPVLPDEPCLTTVGDYDVTAVLGRGGMGVVCRARDRLLRREVALKLLHSGVLASDDERRRFRMEAESVSQLRHPHLMVIHEADEADGQLYYTMLLAEHGSLQSRLRREGPLDPQATAQLLSQISAGVHHAHSHGVLHRDLKSANILFDSEDTPLVSDFGLARLTNEASHSRTGSLIGTPAYLAPEVASGQSGHTIGSDVYALGVILYECLTGRLPFEHAAPLELLRQINEQSPPSPRQLAPDVDRDLEAICLRALAKSTARRYASAADLRDDLQHWLVGEPVKARLPPLTERLWRFGRRHQTSAVLYTMAALSLLLLMAASAMMNLRLSNEQSQMAHELKQAESRELQALHELADLHLGSTATWHRLRPQLARFANLPQSAEESTANLLRQRFLNYWQSQGQRLPPPQATSQPPPTKTESHGWVIQIQPKGELWIWRGHVGQRPPDLRLAHSSPVTAYAESQSNLACMTSDGQLHLWHLSSARRLAAPMAIPLNQPQLAWTTSQSLYLWDASQQIRLDW